MFPKVESKIAKVTGVVLGCTLILITLSGTAVVGLAFIYSGMFLIKEILKFF